MSYMSEVPAYKFANVRPNYFLYPLTLNLTEKELYDLRVSHACPTSSGGYIPRTREPGAKLRLGFISRDFSENRPSGQLSGEFFKHLSQMAPEKNIEVFLYAFPNTVSRTFRQYGTVRTHPSVFRLMHYIYNDSIDILIDMQGHMHNNFNRGLAQKPAPIIIHWLGYPGTSGLQCIDYHIADRIIIPESSQQYYTEKILYMPHCYQINNSALLVGPTTPPIFKRSDLNLPEDAFLFCNFNDNYKLDRHTYKIWMDILKAVPTSFLVMCGDASKNRYLIDSAIEHGIPENRLIFSKRLNRYHHIHRVSLMDCGLDPYYCNGHTTTSD